MSTLSGFRFGATASSLVTAPFTPTAIAGCKLWLDAGILALVDGAAVATWADSSGAGNHATQATAGKRPIFRTAAIDGRPAVRFVPTDDALTTALAVPFSGGLTLLFALLMRNVTTASELSGHASDLKSIHLRIAHGGAGVITIYDGSGWQNLSLTGAIPAGTACILAITWDGTRAYARVNGVVKIAGGTAVTGLTWPAGTGFGDALAVGMAPDGDIAEALLYDRLLSAGEIVSVEGYLGTKYGLLRS